MVHFPLPREGSSNPCWQTRKESPSEPINSPSAFFQSNAARKPVQRDCEEQPPNLTWNQNMAMINILFQIPFLRFRIRIVLDLGGVGFRFFSPKSHRQGLKSLEFKHPTLPQTKGAGIQGSLIQQQTISVGRLSSWTEINLESCSLSPQVVQSRFLRQRQAPWDGG